MLMTPPPFIRRQFTVQDLLQLVSPIQTVKILSKRPDREEPADRLRTTALSAVDQTLGAMASGALFRVAGKEQAEHAAKVLEIVLRDKEEPKVDLQATLAFNLIRNAVQIQRPSPIRAAVLALDLLRQCQLGSPFDVELAKRLASITDWNTNTGRLTIIRQK